MLTHTRVLTLNRSIPINGNISSVASRSPLERWASIRMQRIHHLKVCANTTEQIINGNTSCITSRSPSERWASIRMQYIWVCVLTHTCVLTNTYIRVQLSCICDNKRQLQYHHQRKIGERLVGRRSPARGRGTNFFINTVQS